MGHDRAGDQAGLRTADPPAPPDLPSEQLARLHRVGDGLARAGSPDEVIEIVVRDGIAGLPTRGAVLALLDGTGDRLTLVGAEGFDPGVTARFEGSPLATPLPITDAIRTGTPVWLRSRAERDQRYPALASTAGPEASASLPLTAGDRTFGALGISFAGTRDFPEGDRLFLQALAGECSLALERLRLLALATDRAVGGDAGAEGRSRVADGPTVAQLEAAIDAAGIGTWEWDLRSGSVRWNHHHAAMFRIDPGSFDGTYEAFAARLLPAEEPVVRAALERAIATGEQFEREFRIVLPDGSTRWIAGRGQVTYDEDGRPERMTGIVIDRTEARSLAERMARTLETITDAFVAVDHRWRVTYANAQAEQLLGRTRKDLVGRTLWETFPHAVGTDVEAAYRAAVSSGEPVTLEAFDEGLGRWFEIRSFPSGDGLSIYFHDVSERRELEAQRDTLFAAESRARDAADRVLRLAAAVQGELNPRQAAQRICQATVEVFDCDRAAVWLVNGDDARLSGMCPDDGVLRLDEVRSLEPDLLEALRRGTPVFVADLRRDGTPMQRAWSERLGIRASLSVPVALDGGTKVLLNLGWKEPVAGEDVPVRAVVDRLADQVALALEQGGRREAQAEVVRLNGRLQAGLLPTFSVRAPGVSVSSSYRAGEHRLLLGGDFFDVLELGTGEIAVLMGDVTGHGPDAAALGTMLRAAWRGLALHGVTPTGALRALDAVLRAERTTDEAFATLGCIWIAPDRRSATVVLAGHPNPVLTDRDGPRAVGAHHGLALGILPDGPDDYQATTIELTAPWTLLAYTDGLIEARTAPGSAERFGAEGLLAALHGAPPAGVDGAFLHDLLARVEERSGEPFADDVAVVAVSYRPPD